MSKVQFSSTGFNSHAIHYDGAVHGEVRKDGNHWVAEGGREGHRVTVESMRRGAAAVSMLHALGHISAECASDA